MKLSEFEAILKKSRAEVNEYIRGLIFSTRNSTLAMCNDYYDGVQWTISSGSSNTSRSGKRVWGKSKSGLYDHTDKLARKGGANKELSFSEGQLRKSDYIQLFVGVYQDFAAGVDDSTDITIKLDEEGNEKVKNIKAADLYLKDLWEEADAKKFFKTQIARSVVNTVAIGSLETDEDGHYIEIEDADTIFPIYKRKKHIGTIKAYMIDAEDAREMGVKVGNKEESVTYAKVFIQKGDSLEFFRLVDGLRVDAPEIPTAEGVAYDPFEIVANIDHPKHSFDENHLESSEIFSWIDSTDALNANRTIEFIANQYLAMPKVSIDFAAAEKLRVDMSSPEFRQALEDFEFFPGSIDSLPITLQDGKTVPESFYKGLENIKTGLFESAGIPPFLLSAEGFSNVKAETLQLGMAMLTRKINQKRQQITNLVKKLSIKALKAGGYIDPLTKEKEVKISVYLPNITELSVKDLIDYMKIATDSGWVDPRYAMEETLKAIGKSGDIDKVTNLRQENTSKTLEAVRAKKAEMQSAQLIETQSDSITK